MKYLRPITMAILLLAAGTPVQKITAGGAKLAADQTVFNFGFIPAGESVGHSYYFLNKGSDSLKILKVQPGCGCTKAPLKKDVVAAGDSAEVELIFSASKGSKGPIVKAATVTSNDSDQPTLQITFKGTTYTDPESLSPLTLSTATLAWDDKTRDQEAKVVVKNTSRSTVKMHLVSQPYGYLKIDYPDGEIKPGKEKDIKVRIDPAAKDQDFRKSFTFELSDSAGTRYTIPATLSKPAIVQQIQPPPSKKMNNAPLDTTRRINK
jgi:hypothetical protein